MLKLLNQNSNYTNDFDLIVNRIYEIRKDITLHCIKCKRNINDIKLMLVTKGVDPEILKKLDPQKYEFDFFGENYIQEFEKKFNYIGNNTILDRKYYHFIGHLQTNKINKVIKYFSSIDSIDSISLLESVSKKSLINNSNNVMIEIKTTEENSKSGISPDEFLRDFEKFNKIKNVNITGLMTMGPLSEDEELIRKSYKTLINVWQKLKDRYQIELPFISMGMSNDYKIALEEGSTLLRIGRAIFGR